MISERMKIWVDSVSKAVVKCERQEKLTAKTFCESFEGGAEYELVNGEEKCKVLLETIADMDPSPQEEGRIWIGNQ